MNADGTVNAAGSKSFATANVTKPASTTGAYCFHGLAAVPKNVEATANNQNYGALNVETDSSAFNNPAICGTAPGTQFAVLTFISGGSVTNMPFFVMTVP